MVAVPENPTSCIFPILAFDPSRAHDNSTNRVAPNVVSGYLLPRKVERLALFDFFQFALVLPFCRNKVSAFDFVLQR
jgi:hypothetical protein